MRWIVPFSVIALISCSTEQKHDIGQYVYMDCINQIHIDRECASSILQNAQSKEERILSSKGIVFVDTCELSHKSSTGTIYPLTFCPRCIDDANYTQLSKIIQRNEQGLEKSQ